MSGIERRVAFLQRCASQLRYLLGLSTSKNDPIEEIRDELEDSIAADMSQHYQIAADKSNALYLRSWLGGLRDDPAFVVRSISPSILSRVIYNIRTHTRGFANGSWTISSIAGVRIPTMETRQYLATRRDRGSVLRRTPSISTQVFDSISRHMTCGGTKIMSTQIPIIATSC